MAEGIQMKHRVLTLRSAHGVSLSIARQILYAYGARFNGRRILYKYFLILLFNKRNPRSVNKKQRVDTCKVRPLMVIYRKL